MSKSIKIPVPEEVFQQKHFPELTSNLNSLEKVSNLTTSVDNSTIEFDIDNADAVESILHEFSNWGYQIPTNTITLGITGMTCASCVMHIETCISNLTGVIKSNVNLATNQATVTVLNGTVSDSEISDSITDIGYGAFDVSNLNKNQNPSISNSTLIKQQPQ